MKIQLRKSLLEKAKDNCSNTKDMASYLSKELGTEVTVANISAAAKHFGLNLRKKTPMFEFIDDTIMPELKNTEYEEAQADVTVNSSNNDFNSPMGSY